MSCFFDKCLILNSGQVDELIITPQSTFGAVAAFRGGRLPLYVLYDKCKKAVASYGPGGHWEGMLLW